MRRRASTRSKTTVRKPSPSVTSAWEPAPLDTAAQGVGLPVVLKSAPGQRRCAPTNESCSVVRRQGGDVHLISGLRPPHRPVRRNRKVLSVLWRTGRCLLTAQSATFHGVKRQASFGCERACVSLPKLARPLREKFRPWRQACPDFT
jgi:hypothetical protein